MHQPSKSHMQELTLFVFPGSYEGKDYLWKQCKQNVKHPENEFSVGCFFDHEWPSIVKDGI